MTKNPYMQIKLQKEKYLIEKSNKTYIITTAYWGIV